MFDDDLSLISVTVNLVMVKINEYSSAAISLCAVLEYLCTELLEMGGIHADETLLPRHLRAAVTGDCEYLALVDQLGASASQLQRFMFRSLTEPQFEQHENGSDNDDEQSDEGGDDDDDVAASESDECDPDPLDDVGDRLPSCEYGAAWLDEMREHFAPTHRNRQPTHRVALSSMPAFAARVRKILRRINRGLRISDECLNAIELFLEHVRDRIVHCAVQLAFLSGARTVSRVDIHNATQLCVSGRLAANALSHAKRASTQYVRNCPFRAGAESRSNMAGQTLSVEWCSRALREHCNEAGAGATTPSEVHSMLPVRILAHDPHHGYCGHMITINVSDGDSVGDLLLHVRQEFARCGLKPPAQLRCTQICHVHGERDQGVCSETTALVALAKQLLQREEQLYIHCDY